MRIKSGENGCRLGPQLAMAAMFAIFSGLENTLKGEFELTSGREGQHMFGSLHYVDHAVDVTWSGVWTQDAIASTLRSSLGDDFDVVNEHTHVHIEFQPKKAL